MKRYIFILIACMITSGVVSWFLSAYLTSRSLETQFATIELNEISNDSRASSVLNRVNVTDNAEFDNITFTKVLTVALFRPDISNLEGAPLNTLCRLIVYRQKGGFIALQSTYIKKIIFNYLDSQRNAVFGKLSELRSKLPKARQYLVTEGVITPELLKKINSRDQPNTAEIDLCR